jgi:hypothetical protein
MEINTWTNDINDNSLLDLISILKDIYNYKIKDIKEILKKINEEVVSRVKKNIPYWYKDIDISKYT